MDLDSCERVATGGVPGENWGVVSFHAAAEHELIEERPATGAGDTVQQKRYAEDRSSEWRDNH